MTAEQRLREWAKQPETAVSPAEWQFLAAVQQYAGRGVGFGFMAQVIEWEWQHYCERMGFPGGAWGPEYYDNRIRELEAELVAARQRAETEGE